MNRIYFRDFLDKVIALNGDITKIVFVSSSLVSKYEIQGLSGRELICTRIRPTGKREQAMFVWGPRIQTHGIHAKFVVKSIARKLCGSTLVPREQLIVTLANSENR